MERCKACSANLVQTAYSSLVCPRCGVENFGALFDSQRAYGSYCVPLHPPATYTRCKRFRKYLLRAGLEQSASSVPGGTWEYLLDRAPFSSPGAIIRCLKSAPRTINKKCYDSLPLLCRFLCPDVHVPMLLENDKYQAMSAFRKLDEQYGRGEPFVSYLYALEYILELIGRADVLPFINKIQCRKRRHAYRYRLDAIFKHTTPA